MTVEGPSVLIVDDEPSLVEALAVGLAGEGFEVRSACDGEQAIELLRVAAPHLILLGVTLPTSSGLDVLRGIRDVSTVPVIMVSARRAEVDIVALLEAGADDYVAKPYRLRELVARMRALLRRVPALEHGDRAVAARVFEAGDVVLDRDRHEVLVRGEPMRLPLKEFGLLEILLANAGRVLTRQLLIDRVWGPRYRGDPKTLDVHIKRLRGRIEVTPAAPQRIVTVRGLGYKFESKGA
jgi:two-component system response regulator RegX3